MEDEKSDVILKYLQKEGYNVSNNEYYNYIEQWEEWMENDVNFHSYHDSSGKKRKMYTLGMAKRLCEDWSSVLFSERDVISTKTIALKNEEDEKAKIDKNNKYLQQKLIDLGVYDELPEQLEEGMGTGTIAAIVRIENAKLNKEKELIIDNRTKMKLVFVGARHIRPLKIENGKIVNVAFISEDVVNDKKEYYIEIHELIYSEERNREVYRIRNIYLDDEGNPILKEKVVSSFTINSSIPLFSIFKPAISNPLKRKVNTIGLGFSVFGTAIDQLKSVDINYNNFVMDFYLGGKKVFYSKKITKTRYRRIKDIDGNIKEEAIEVYPDDVSRQQFVAIGEDDIANLKEKPVISEYNPELRVEEDVQGIEFALNLLSFKAGLGNKYYKFENGRVVTATEYDGDRQDFIKNANKHRVKVTQFIAGICKAILMLGRIVFKEDVTEECNIVVEDSDGFLVDTEKAKQEFRNDIAQGIRQAWEYRVRFLGESPEVAKAAVSDETITNININE